MTWSLKRILVPIDFSLCSRKAIEHAAFLAAKTGAAIDAVHVWQLPPYLSPDSVVNVPGEEGKTLSQAAHAELDTFMGSLEPELRGVLTPRLQFGDPLSTILEEAKRYDLIVMGTHGRTGLAAIVVGSVAEKIVRHAPCPVLTVRAPGEQADSGVDSCYEFAAAKLLLVESHHEGPPAVFHLSRLRRLRQHAAAAAAARCRRGNSSGVVRAQGAP